jgi:hypothetical protein
MGESFKKTFPSIQYTDTANVDRNGDAVITINDLPIMIDYKNYNQPIPTSEVDKLVRDLTYRDISLGILYSTKSRISKKDIIDYDIIEGKLIVYMCSEGISANSLMLAVKFILHLHDINILSISDKVSELTNKTVGNKLQSMYCKLVILKDSLQRQNDKIDDTSEKITKHMNSLKEDSVHMLSSMLDIVGNISEIVDENHRESEVITSSHELLVDMIRRSTDKKRDITHCLRLLTVATDMNISCGISETNHIVLYKGRTELGKLKITKSNATLIMYNLVEGPTMFHSSYEEMKHGNFHIILTDKAELWKVIQGRFT